MSLYDWLPSLFAPLLLLCGAYLSTHVIPHGACRVFYHRGGSGERLVLPAGVRVCNPLVWAPLRGPLYGIIADDFFPVPGTILDIPIPLFSVRTGNDMIHVCDLVVDCTVLKWSVDELLRIQHMSCKTRAEAAINQWAVDIVADRNATSLFSHLNAPDKLELINAELAPLFLKVERIIPGPLGVRKYIPSSSEIKEVKSSVSRHDDV